MNIEQLAKGLAAKFDKARLVFWFDPEQSFVDLLDTLPLADVRVVNLAQVSLFELKKQLEIDHPQQRALLYAPMDEPAADDDWLLDIKLYAERFYADTSSMLLAELGLASMALRPHMRARHQFLAAAKRVEALKRWITGDEDEAALDLKMAAVVVRAPAARLDDVLYKLLQEYADVGADGPSPLWDSLEKYGLTATLWQQLAEQYGYGPEPEKAAENPPSLPDFVLKLFCSELWTVLGGSEGDWLASNVIKGAGGRAQALAFLASWRRDRDYAAAHDRLSAQLASQLELDRRLRDLPPSLLAEAFGFEVIEQGIIRLLVRDLQRDHLNLDWPQFEQLLSRRRDGHWCARIPEYQALYQALYHGAQLLLLRQRFDAGFGQYPTAKAMFTAYTTELYLFDQHYRLFNEHAHQVLSKGAEIIRDLDTRLEELYSNWFLPQFGMAWDNLVAREGLLNHWQLDEVPRQDGFFRKQIRPLLANKGLKRVFVIISDALRYEVAEELYRTLGQDKRYALDLQAQLGVLPSYTQLGMAALLPHQELSYRAGGTPGLVYADGQSTAGPDARAPLLAKVNGLVVTHKALLEWAVQEGRDRIRDVEVVYIYHDTIDATGDKQATEEKTIQACREALRELRDLVYRIVNRFNGNRILITADHGFVFQQQAPATQERTGLGDSVSGAVLSKKRFVIGNGLPTLDACWKGSTRVTAGTSCDTEFLLPKANNRFHFVGGARFIHGGLMPQEICVPMLTIRERDGEQARKHDKVPVGVVVASSPVKLVSSLDKIRFIQTDAVDDRHRARSLLMFIQDPQGNRVSDVEQVSFDSASEVMQDRMREVRFKLLGASFDRLLPYTLVLQDPVTQVPYSQYTVTIDLAFQDDFF